MRTHIIVYAVPCTCYKPVLHIRAAVSEAALAQPDEARTGAIGAQALQAGKGDTEPSETVYYFV